VAREEVGRMGVLRTSVSMIRGRSKCTWTFCMPNLSLIRCVSEGVGVRMGGCRCGCGVGVGEGVCLRVVRRLGGAGRCIFVVFVLNISLKH
jgi:hypothetical protein